MPKPLLLVLVLVAAGVGQAPPRAPSAPVLARMWDAERVSSPYSPLVDHADVRRRVEALAADAAGPIRVREVGRSAEGRAIWDVSFGSGPFVVLMWSQMHGDEATATSALFDVYEYVRRHAEEPPVRALLAALTVHTVPMLNPDGAERWQRRNAQGLDVNRDALLLQSPEGRLLKRLRDELEPGVGFNLHNQGWRTSVGRPPKGAAISLLSVAFDEGRSMSEGRALTRKLGAVVRDALEPFALGRLGRYDDSFEVRAFGDNLTKWGTPVLLIETGPWPEPNPDPMLVRFNYIALIRALHALADGSVHEADPARYDELPENESLGFHTLIRNVTIVSGTGLVPFTGDVGLVVTRRVRVVDGERRLVNVMTVDDLGDLRTYGGLFEVDGTGLRLEPAGETPLLPGQPANLALVRGAGDTREIVRAFRAEEEIR